jgi:LPXTG-motif cell wall-anchored protein
MVGLMVIGLVWIVVFYITQGSFPIGSLNNWNLLIGFALLMAGFFMTTRWR